MIGCHYQPSTISIKAAHNDVALSNHTCPWKSQPCSWRHVPQPSRRRAHQTWPSGLFGCDSSAASWWWYGVWYSRQPAVKCQRHRSNHLGGYATGNSGRPWPPAVVHPGIAWVPWGQTLPSGIPPGILAVQRPTNSRGQGHNAGFQNGGAPSPTGPHTASSPLCPPGCLWYAQPSTGNSLLARNVKGHRGSAPEMPHLLQDGPLTATPPTRGGHSPDISLPGNCCWLLFCPGHEIPGNCGPL